MSEIIVSNPQALAGEMRAQHLQDQQEATVNNWVNITDEQSFGDFEAYFASRPFEDTSGKLHEPNGKYTSAKKINSIYDIDSQERAINTVIETETLADDDYESMGMVELARRLGDSQRAGDKTTAENLTDSLLGKMTAFADVNKLTPDAQDALFDRLLKVADAKANQTVSNEPITAGPQPVAENQPYNAEAPGNAEAAELVNEVTDAQARVIALRSELQGMALQPSQPISLSAYKEKLNDYIHAYAAAAKESGLDLYESRKRLLSNIQKFDELYHNGPNINPSTVINGVEQPETTTIPPVETVPSFREGVTSQSQAVRKARKQILKAEVGYHNAKIANDEPAALEARNRAKEASLVMASLMKWDTSVANLENKLFQIKFDEWLFEPPTTSRANQSVQAQANIAAEAVPADQEVRTAYELEFQLIARGIRNAKSANDKKAINKSINQAMKLLSEQAQQNGWDDQEFRLEQEKFMGYTANIEIVPEQSFVTRAFNKVRSAFNKDRQPAQAAEAVASQEVSQQARERKHNPKRNRLILGAIGAVGLVLAVAAYNNSDDSSRKLNDAYAVTTTVAGSTASTTPRPARQTTADTAAAPAANSSKQKLGANGDNIWNHAQQQIVQGGNSTPTLAQIDEMKDSILRGNNLTEEAARHLPVDYEFTA